MKKKIDRRNEDLQRADIIKISTTGDASHLGEMIRLLSDERTSYGNCRHIVRALGEIGGTTAEQTLLKVLSGYSGLILGDAAEAVGKLRIRDSLSILEKLTDHEEEWVRQKSNWAIGRIRE